MSHLKRPGHVRLGVNIDHVATIRNARGGLHPDPVRAANIAAAAGADGITAHLREDRRHISDDDIARLRGSIERPLNLEMAATSEMLDIALAHRPNACCLVPERREELTTEGGLNVAGQDNYLATYVAKIRAAGIRASLFIDPDEVQVTASHKVKADIVELHTGQYCEAALNGDTLEVEAQLARLRQAARRARALGLEVHAGHGLTYDTIAPVAAIPELVEVNIGHFLIGEAIFTGLEDAVRRMRAAIDEARQDVPA